MATTTQHKTTLHYIDSEKDGYEVCKHLMFQTRPINLQSSHTKRLSKLILKSVLRSFYDEGIPFMVYGSDVLNDWELLTYQYADGGMDMYTTRLIGNYKYFMVVFAAGKNTLIQQIDAVYSERFTQTFR